MWHGAGGVASGSAFSKITEISNVNEKPAKKILFITDIAKLDEREVNLLISLNSKNKPSFFFTWNFNYQIRVIFNG